VLHVSYVLFTLSGVFAYSVVITAGRSKVGNKKDGKGLWFSFKHT